MDLAAEVRDAKPNDTVKVPAGRYTVNLEVTKPLTLLAMGQVVLDGVHSGSVIRVSSDGVVRLSGFMIVGGNAPEAGGAVSVLNGQVELTDCTLRFNKAPLYGGGGLYVRDAKVVAQRCRFEANTGRQGGAILVDGVGELRLLDSTVIQNAAVEGGGIRVKEGAKLEIDGCTLADNKVVGDGAIGGALHIAGTTTRAPVVTVTGSIISERSEGPTCVFNSPKLPGALTVTKTLLPTWSKNIEGAGNVYADPEFAMSGTEPYLLTEKSPAVGAGSVGSGKDVTGRARKADLGAFTYVAGGNSNVGY